MLFLFHFTSQLQNRLLVPQEMCFLCTPDPYQQMFCSVCDNKGLLLIFWMVEVFHNCPQKVCFTQVFVRHEGQFLHLVEFQISAINSSLHAS